MTTEPTVKNTIRAPRVRGEVHRRPEPSGPTLGEIEARAKRILETQLASISAKHSRHSARLKSIALGHTTGRITISISGEGIWRDISPTKEAMCERIQETLQAKYGGRFEIRVAEGSIEWTIIWAAFETARQIYELVTSINNIVEYIIRCVEQNRMDWPPIASMFTVLEALKKWLLGF